MQIIYDQISVAELENWLKTDQLWKQIKPFSNVLHDSRCYPALIGGNFFDNNRQNV